jgi:hypothetical protein
MQGALNVWLYICLENKIVVVEVSISQDQNNQIQSLKYTNHTHIYTTNVLAYRLGYSVPRVVHRGNRSTKMRVCCSKTW